ncbi:MAG: glycosyltransferase family 2 protein [Rhodobacteraceae bacterium]|nr:glycosyltransferase family 2 protein [Paracoccaceae bacterium]MCZ8085515.1 glycosyltransferase family 2 protein [Paracoccaceae bacterium]
MKRLVAVGTVRNEEDIIEAFVRHSLRYVDELRLVDHLSTDRTPAILTALQAEGLPLHVIRHSGQVLLQEILLTRLAREAFRSGADWVVPLDADEFIEALDPSDLRAAVAHLDQTADGAIAWWPLISMVPHSDDDLSIADPVRRIVHRLAIERVQTPKCLVPRAITLRPDWQIAPGSHHVQLGSKDPLPMVRMAGGIALRHYPLRSVPQMMAKIVLGHLAWRPRLKPGSTVSGHNTAIFRRLRAGWIPTAQDLTRLAANYHDPDHTDLPLLVHNPLIVVHVLKHGSHPETPLLPKLLDWAEGVVASNTAPVTPVTFRESLLDFAAATAPPPVISEAAARIFNRANGAFRQGRFAEVVELLSPVPAALAEWPLAHVLLARALRTLGDASGARSAFDAALACDPAQFDALLERGNLRRAQNDLDGAAADYASAMAARSADPRPALALARLEEDRSEAARLPGPKQAAAERAAIAIHRALDRALKTEDPARAAAGLCHDLARQRLARADLPRALDALREARSWADGGAADLVPQIDIALVEVLLRLGMEPEAQVIIERLSTSADRDVLRPLAQLAYHFNHWAIGVTILRHAADLSPGNPEGWLELADMQAKSWMLEEALASLGRAETAGNVPRTADLALRASVANRLGDARTALAQYDQLVKDGQPAFASNAAMSLLYADHITPEEVAARHRELFAGWDVGARARTSFRFDPNPHRPLRIGMVSADLHHQHPVNIFLQPLLARWDHENLPLTVFFTGLSADDQTRLARARARNWRDVTLPELPSAVAADSIDILIDLSGHTAGGALALFARRLAPVQATWLGYPGTTGVPNMDWLIGDPVVTPLEADGLCSEQVMRLPDTVFCFAPEANHPLPDFAVATRGRPFTFGSFNNLPKLTPRTIALWSAALAEVPDARLLLRAPSFKDATAIARFRRLFAEAGTDPDRLVFRGPLGLDAMMKAYAEIDVALDPVPYNGGTTTLQALWMGVPVLTLKGGHFVSRMGASLLSAAGLADWVADTETAFVARARAAAEDHQTLIALKQGLRSLLLSRPAWNPDRFAASFHDALRNIWTRTMADP